MTDHASLLRRYVAGFLAEHHICMDCETRGFINPANRCHLMRERTHPAEKLRLSYCVPLCTRCYSKRERMSDMRTAEYAEIGG